MGRRRKPKKCKLGVHQTGVDDLTQKLINKGYYDHVYKNIEYPLGECDSLAVTDKRTIYFEYKCNHTDKGYKKMLKQLQRYTSYMARVDPSKNHYGIYVPGNSYLELICKNGRLRKYDR